MITHPTSIYHLPLHAALPISLRPKRQRARCGSGLRPRGGHGWRRRGHARRAGGARNRSERSEEHTSELQSRRELVCSFLLEKKKKYDKQKSCETDIIRTNI